MTGANRRVNLDQKIGIEISKVAIPCSSHYLKTLPTKDIERFIFLTQNNHRISF